MNAELPQKRMTEGGKGKKTTPIGLSHTQLKTEEEFQG